MEFSHVLIGFSSMYLVWIPLSLLSIYIEYRRKLKRIAKNVNAIGHFGRQLNKLRNTKRKALKDEYKSYYIASLIPAINIVISLNIFSSQKQS